MLFERPLAAKSPSSYGNHKATWRGEGVEVRRESWEAPVFVGGGVGVFISHKEAEQSLGGGRARIGDSKEEIYCPFPWLPELITE